MSIKLSNVIQINKNWFYKFQKCLNKKEDILYKKTIALDNQFHCTISNASGCQNLSEILEKFRGKNEE